MPPRPAFARLGWVLAALGAMASPAARGQDTVGPEAPYAAVAAALSPWIEAEMAGQGLPAASIALVDGDRIVWARGFGTADPDRGIPCTARTVHRVGSVSKLFTDLAAMQLVEQGKLDLDTPIRAYLPDFEPANPSGRPITLRHLMSHRSGLARESPVGHYFDPTAPGLAESVRSLNRTALVYEPGERTKYSNAAVATVGRVVERVGGRPFAEIAREGLLGPLGMEDSDFDTGGPVAARVACGLMWTLDGREFPAPRFAIAHTPAGNLYSTAADLGRFLVALFADGRGPGGAIVRPGTLETMWSPQFVRPGEAPPRFGLGFAVDGLDGHRRVGHNGAVYGFATELAALPDEKLGAVVIVTRDCANGAAGSIADIALRMMLAAREGKPLRVPPRSEPIDPALARTLSGRYRGESGIADLVERNGRLSLEPFRGLHRVEVRRLGDGLAVVDPTTDVTPLEVEGETLTVGEATYRRADSPRPEPAPDRWAGLIGEYGWDHDVLSIREKDGKLHALIEWFFDDPLEEAGPDTFRFPRSGLYDGESLVFTRDASGRAVRVEAAGVVFERRPIDGEDGTTFRVDPVRPVAELRPEALAASPPPETGDFLESDLVDLTVLDPTIRLDVRYATENNFLGTPFYTSARAFLQRPAAEALVRAHRALEEDGYGLLIHDAYRPWHVTKMFFDATPDASKGFVADPAKGSKHNRGAAVDLTLYDRATGTVVPMVGGYDEFSARSAPDYPGGTSRQRWHRDLLRRAMEDRGFTVNSVEWWHFDHRDWPRYRIGNATFEELGR